MKKSGFTLAELLIALGIVGVISALLATALLTLQPDQQKAIYLKNYDALSKAVKELAHNDRLFPICQDNLNCQEHPLFNTSSGVGGRFVAIGEGDGKLCRGLSYVFNGQMLPNLNCDNQPLTYEDGDWTPSFRTYRTEWLVSTLRELSGSSATYQSDVYFDLNGPAAPNCVYGDNCKNPDRFKFLVAANGTVIPADPIGQEYIKTRKNWRKSNLNISEDRSTKETLLADLRSFILNPCAGGGGATGGEGNGTIETKYFSTLIPCGANFEGITINCFTSSRSVFDIKYGEDLSKYPYPALFNPSTYVFDFPVASNLIIEEGIGDPVMEGSNVYEQAPIYAINTNPDFPDTEERGIGSCNINQNNLSCTQNNYYYRNVKNKQIQYPTTFDKIINNVQIFCALKKTCSIYDKNSLNFNFGRIIISYNIGEYSSAKITPRYDNKYLYAQRSSAYLTGFDNMSLCCSEDAAAYLYLAKSGTSDDTELIRLAVQGGNNKRVIEFLTSVWNIDNPDINIRRQAVKNPINAGYNVQITLELGNFNPFIVDARLLNLK